MGVNILEWMEHEWDFRVDMRLNFALPFTSQVALGQLLHLSEPQYCPLQDKACHIVL